MKYFIQPVNVLIVLVFCFTLFAGEDQLKEGRELSRQAYLQYNRELFLQARSVFEKQYNSNKSSLLPLYNMTLVDYKLLEIGLRDGENLFDKYYETALKNAEILSNDGQFAADGKILSASIYMMKIANSSMSAITLSPKIHSLLDEAQKINPNNPLSYLVRGIMKYNTPGIFGGSYEDALKNCNQAIKLYEKDSASEKPTPVWGYIEALAWAGRSLEALENYDAAEFTYNKALKVESEYGWVKYVLLPGLQKTASEK